MLTHWSYIFLALTYQYYASSNDHIQYGPFTTVEIHITFLFPERNAQYLDAETERLQAELEQEQIRQREEQRILQLQEERRREEQRREEERREQQRREEQWRQEQRREEERREDDRRMRDQHDARLLKEKEEQIQAMEVSCWVR